MAVSAARRFQLFALRALSEGRITVVRQVFDPSVLRVELARIGNNVNQVARLANTHEVATERELAEVRRLLRDVQALISESMKVGE